jgi:hypothetical protein
MSLQSRLLEALLGLKGFEVVTSGNTVDHNDHESGFFRIYAHSGNMKFEATCSCGDSVSETNVHEGGEVFGHFTSITCTSGELLAYRL